MGVLIGLPVGFLGAPHHPHQRPATQRSRIDVARVEALIARPSDSAGCWVNSGAGEEPMGTIRLSAATKPCEPGPSHFRRGV